MAFAGRVLGETAHPTYRGQYEWEWSTDPTLTRVNKNANGTSGWGNVYRSSNPAYPQGKVIKMHLCAHNPCQANYFDGKYGVFGPPVHMQGITCMGPAAAPLLPLTAAAPASPKDVADDTAVAETAATQVTAVATAAQAHDTAAAAHARVHAAVLSLVRELRRPKSYVGYIAFILFGLCNKCQPCAWEGGNFINLLGVYAPWAIEISRKCVITAIPCALDPKSGGIVECVPISVSAPLSKVSHYVAGMAIPPQTGRDGEETFEAYYARLGVATMPTVCDGDCGLDVMNKMLGLPDSFATRKQLRDEISDYLLDRIGELWMLEILVAAQELDNKDVKLSSSHAFPSEPPAQETAVAAPTATAEEEGDHEQVTEETLSAMRWASKLGESANVLALIRSLPAPIVEEQVMLYRKRDDTAIAAVKPADQKVAIGRNLNHHQRMVVAQRFHKFCQSRGITPDMRMPYGQMKTFIQDNVEWTSKQQALQSKQIRGWYNQWRLSKPDYLTAAVAGKPSVTHCVKIS